MKILLSLNQYTGSGIFGSRFLKHIQHHSVKLMSYYKNNRIFPVMDWVIDPIVSGNDSYFYDNFSLNKSIKTKAKLTDWILDDVALFNPDLIISYAEPIAALIGRVLNIKVWYCSPTFLANICPDAFRGISNQKENLPEADRYFVYAPSFVEPLKRLPEYEIIEPYVNDSGIYINEKLPIIFKKVIYPENSIITTGEMSYACDCLNKGQRIVLTPDFNNREQVATSYVFDYYKYGKNIYRPKSFSLLNDSLRDLCDYKTYTPTRKYLHEEINGIN